MKAKRILASIALSFFVLTQVQVPIYVGAETTPPPIDDGYKYDSWKDVGETNVTVVTGADTVNVYTWKPDKYNPRLTEVYSINSKLKDKCYYMPKADDIPNLKEYVQQQGKFVEAYMGYYDLSNGLNSSETIKPAGSQSRALEILGYDFLLSKEEYKNNTYNPELTAQTISFGTAVMDIYKALGKELYDVSLFMSDNPELTLDKSPAVKGLPSYVSGVDNSDGKTEVFITRTNPAMYMAKAQKDMNISSTDNINRNITYGEFFVLLTRMMKYYGEPVMSELEMNQLLQVYGSDVPLYLTDIEKDAFLYLKSRGVLNIDVAWESTLLIEDMLDVLMCVKDKDSRTDYKKIQVVVALDDELINKGYFPRDLNLNAGDNFLETESSFDYSKAHSYDYYISISDEVTFKNKNGKLVQNPYIPKDPSYVSEAYMNSYFAGVVDGKYYHFIIPKDYPYPNVTINTKDADDRPEFWEVPAGGGIYEVKSNDGKAVYFDRKPFEELQFDGSADKERVNASKSENTASNWSVVSLLSAITRPMFVKVNAAALGLDGSKTLSSNGARVKVKVSKGYDAIANLAELQKIAAQDGTFEVVLDKENKIVDLISDTLSEQQILSKINATLKEPDKAVQATGSNSSLSGNQSSETPTAQSIGRIDSTANQMVDYNLLVEKGLFERTMILPKPNQDTSVLTLYSRYGAVKLNNKTREVCVGNILYKVPKGINLYAYQIDTRTGKEQLLVDFRAAYGWTRNIIKINVVGTGGSQAINICDSEESDFFRTDYIESPAAMYDTYSPEVFVRDYKKEDQGTDLLAMASTYPIANWFIYQGEDGVTEDYLFVFYLKEMFTSLGIEDKMPDDSKLMANILGYGFEVENWCVRAFKLRVTTNKTPGQVNHIPEVGYCYNIPVVDKKFDIKRYLTGELWLPIVHFKDTTKEASRQWRIKNVSMNYFEGVKYGEYVIFDTSSAIAGPAIDSITGEPIPPRDVGAYSYPIGEAFRGSSLDISTGKKYTVSEAAKFKTIPSPSGISAFLGGMDDGSYTTLETLTSRSNSKKVFFGSSLVSAIDPAYADKNYKSLQLIGNSTFVKLPNSQKAYKATKVGLDSDIFVVTSGEVTMTKSDALEKEKLDMTLGTSVDDKFKQYEPLKLKHMITFIDNGTSLAIYVALTIIPTFFLTLLTLIMGLSMISQIKLVQKFCAKFFDPVEICTFGNMTIVDLDFRKIVWSITIAYIVFALVLDGNLLRVIMWLIEWYNEIILLLKGAM